MHCGGATFPAENSAIVWPPSVLHFGFGTAAGCDSRRRRTAPDALALAIVGMSVRRHKTVSATLAEADRIAGEESVCSDTGKL